MTAPDGQPADLPTSDCTICRHPDAATIDAGLLAGTPIRSIAGTYELSRSSVHRHRTNHLTVQTITEPDPEQASKPLRIVDVHQQLTALADRLEAVVELASRTRKAPAAVAGARELRQTLVAIADIQANPELKAAAALEVFNDWAGERAVDAWSRMIDLVLEAFGVESREQRGAPFAAFAKGPVQSQIVAGLLVACIRAVQEHGTGAQFGDVDTSEARAFVERQALDRAGRMEAEVQRRVETELRRREAQARPAIEAREVRAIEGGGSAWTA